MLSTRPDGVPATRWGPAEQSPKQDRDFNDDYGFLIIWTFTFFGCCDLLLARTAHSGKNRFGHLVLGTP